MLNDRENILSALREKPLKVYEVMKRANVVNEEVCQSLRNSYRPRLSRHRQMKLTWSSPLPIEDVICNAYSQEQGRGTLSPMEQVILAIRDRTGRPLC